MAGVTLLNVTSELGVVLAVGHVTQSKTERAFFKGVMMKFIVMGRLWKPIRK